MKRSKLQKSTEPQAAGGSATGISAFLYPSMPDAADVGGMDLDELRARYIQVFSASMGNHSLSKFYCGWNQEQFEAAGTAGFEAELSRAREELADRAALIMHRGMGLVAGDGPAVPPTVTAAMAKVVESMSTPAAGKTAKKGYKLTVSGLMRPPQTPQAQQPAVDAPPPGAVKRGRGRPRKLIAGGG